MILRLLLAILCMAGPLLSRQVLAQATTAPTRDALADSGVRLILYVPQVPPKTYQPYSLVLELTNTSDKPVAINQALPPLASFYRDEAREKTAGQAAPKLAVYFERPPGTSRDIDRHQMLTKAVAVVEPGKSHLFHVEIPRGILAPGDNRFTAVLHHNGTDAAESQPLTLHCAPAPGEPR